MRRRDFIKGIAGSAAGWPIALHAQSASAMQRVGWLDLFREDDPFVQGRAEAVREDLAKAGWTVGRNLQIDYRWGVTTPELAQRLCGELLSLSPDVILCSGSPAVRALKQATIKVPIVFVLVAEPVDQGIVESLDHPGANITGFTYLPTAKRLVLGPRKWVSPPSVPQIEAGPSHCTRTSAQLPHGGPRYQINSA